MDTPGTDEADAFANGERGRSLYRFRLGEMVNTTRYKLSVTHAAEQPRMPMPHRPAYHSKPKEAKTKRRSTDIRVVRP